MGQTVTKAETKDMILDYVDRLSKTTGVTLSNEAVVLKLDVTSLNRVLATNPDEVYTFLGIETVGTEKRQTVILMPRKNGAYIKETGATQNLALESWNPISNSTVPHANGIDSTSLNTILS